MKKENDIFEINKDTVLFQIQESFDARYKDQQKFDSHLRYESFLNPEKNQSEIKKDIQFFKKEMKEIVEHHKNILPQYRKQENINLETISWFTLSVSTFVADMQQLYYSLFQNSLPLLSVHEFPRKNSSHTLALALQKMQNPQDENFQLFPLMDAENNDVTNEFIEEFWSFVWYLIRQSFGKYAVLFQDYLLWKYVENKTKDGEETDWNIHPPCGEIYRKTFKQLFDYKDRPDFRNKNRGSEKPSFKNNSNDDNRSAQNNVNDENQSPQNNSSEETQPRFGAHKEKTFVSRKDIEKNNGRFVKDNFRDKRQFREKTTDSKQLDLALQEVHEGIEKLKSQSDLKSYGLKPQNSFVRRQQHVVITDAGYQTESVGDGDERYVSILNK